MPLIDFRFVPTAPEAISGASALDQIERAFNELGEEISSSTGTANEALRLAEQAVATANEAVLTASEAVGISNAASGAADTALTTANEAKTAADAAIARANAAYDMAATADTDAKTALATAQNALTDAQNAKTAADSALQTANDALALAQRSSERVTDVEKKALYFTESSDDADLDTLIDEAKILFTGEGLLTNAPAGLTGGYLEVYPSDGEPGIVLQRFTSQDGGSVFTRTGTVTDDGDHTDFGEWHVPASGSAGESSLLDVQWAASSLEKFGFLRANINHGLIERAVFPQAAAEVQRRFDAGDVYVVTEEAWQEDFAANDGATMLFSTGDGVTTFRLPVLGKGMAPSAPWPEMGLEVGKYVADRMRPITGEINLSSNSGFIASSSTKTGALQQGSTPLTNCANTITHPGYSLALDSKELGPNYSGPITHGPRGVMTPYIKMYGTVTEAGEVSVEALLEAAKPHYDLLEFYSFRKPALMPGFYPRHGGIVENMPAMHPEAWELLKTAEGRAMCLTEAEWQEMSRAVWHTLADGTQVGWNGIGGVPFYAPDWNTGSLRLPDTRGMYTEDAGFDSLDVGGVHGDAIRCITGSFAGDDQPGGFVSGAIYADTRVSAPGNAALYGYLHRFDSSRVVPTGNKNAPRAFGVLPCVYLGVPR